MGMREKLIDLCKQANDELRLRAGCSTWGDFVDILIANGVTIPVRCGECKYCVVMSEGMCCDRALPTKRMEDYYIHGSTVLARFDGDAFCSRGERRTYER